MTTLNKPNQIIEGSPIFELSSTGSPEDSPETTIAIDLPHLPAFTVVPLQGFLRIPNSSSIEGVTGYESPVAFQLLSELDDIEIQLNYIGPTERNLLSRLLKVTRQLTKLIDGQQSVIEQLKTKRTVIR